MTVLYLAAIFIANLSVSDPGRIIIALLYLFRPSDLTSRIQFEIVLPGPYFIVGCNSIENIRKLTINIAPFCCL